MKAIKNLYIIVSMLILMILRPFAPGGWFGSVVVAGLFISWIDTIHKVWKDNLNLTIEQAKIRYAIVMLVMATLGLGLLALIIVNLVINIEWLNSPLVLDELTLVALLLCLTQTTFVGLFNRIINKNEFRSVQ